MITITQTIDAKQILNIAKKTFAETFLEHNTPENLTAYIETSLTLQTVQNQIDNTHSLFYLAEINNEIIGYLKLNFAEAQTELQVQSTIEIERIYVLKSHHGLKIGQALMNKAIDIANEFKMSFIWLGVWENNKKGIDFYNKNGFKVFDKHVFMIGNDAQNDFLMKLIIC